MRKMIERRTKAMKDNKFANSLSELSAVPERLEPENIEKKLQDNKRSKIKLHKRIISSAAAIALIGTSAGTYFYLNRNTPDKDFTRKTLENVFSDTAISVKNDPAGKLTGLKTLTYDELYDEIKAYGDVLDYSTHSDAAGDVQWVGAYGDFGIADEADEEVSFASKASEPTTSANGGSNENSDDYSKTYLQEQGIDEADIIKTDGKNIYYITNDELFALKCDNGKMESKEIDFASLFGKEFEDITVRELYLQDDLLTCIFTNWEKYYFTCWYDDEKTSYDSIERPQITVTAVSFDVSDIDNIKPVNDLSIKGSYIASRMQDGRLYLTANGSLDTYSTYEKGGVPEFAPVYNVNGKVHYVSSGDIYLVDGKVNPSWYTTVMTADMSKKGEPKAVRSVLGSTGEIYQTENRLFVFGTYYDESDEEQHTLVASFDTTDGGLEPIAGTTFLGYLNDRYNLSYRGGVLSVAVNYFGYDEKTYNTSRYNYLLTFDDELTLLGRSEDYGIGEEIKSVFFKDNYAYIVTFMQTDPLFAIDLSDPAHPTIVSELKMPGFSTHMREFIKDRMIGFGNTADEDTGWSTGIKLSMFDTSDPENVKELDKVELSFDDVYDYSRYIYSIAAYDEKALLISGDKNIIAFPYTSYEDNVWDEESGKELSFNNTGYKFYRYTDETGFELIGEYDKKLVSDYKNGIYEGAAPDFYRAIYIGNTYYLAYNGGIVSLNADTFDVIQDLNFFPDDNIIK